MERVTQGVDGGDGVVPGDVLVGLHLDAVAAGIDDDDALFVR